MFIVIDICRGVVGAVYKVDDKEKAIEYRDEIDDDYKEAGEESDSFAVVYQDSGNERMTLIDE